MSRRPRLLISGVTGLLGTALVREGAAYEVWGIGRRPQGAPASCFTKAVDLVDETAVAKAIEVIHPDIVIHTAALTSVDQCEAHPDLAGAVNVGGTKHLLSALSGHACRFIFISTDAVFDGAKGRYAESDAPAPIHVYGKTKLAAEEAVLAERPDALVVRTVFYGWNSLPKESLGEWILSRLRTGKTVPGFCDLRFSPLFSDQLACLIYALTIMPVSGILHLASSDGCSKYDFACSLAGVFGFPVDRVVRMTCEEAGLATPRPRDVTLVTDRAAGILGHPLPSVAAGLQEFRAMEPVGVRAALAAGHATGASR